MCNTNQHMVINCSGHSPTLITCGHQTLVTERRRHASTWSGDYVNTYCKHNIQSETSYSSDWWSHYKHGEDDEQGCFVVGCCWPGIMSGDWDWSRLQCVSSLSQPIWRDPLEVSGMDSVRIISDKKLQKKDIEICSYENTDKSALYTYDVDVCFAAVVAAKLGFPWIYEYFTGRNCKRNNFERNCCC